MGFGIWMGRDQRKNGRKIRNFIINPKFQWIYIGWNTMIALLVIGIVYGANSYFFMEFKEKGKNLGLEPGNVFFKFLESQKESMDNVFLVTAGIIFVVVTVSGAVFSHRIAGPLYRLKKYLHSYRQDSGSLNFRDGDFFQDLAEDVNQFIQENERRHSSPHDGEDDESKMAS